MVESSYLVSMKKEQIEKLIKATSDPKAFVEFSKALANVQTSYSWFNSFSIAIDAYCMGIKSPYPMAKSKWENLGRNIKKGAHAYSILAPCFKWITVKDKVTGIEEKKQVIAFFKVVKTYDLSMTEGTDFVVPTFRKVQGEIKDYFETMKANSPCPIEFETMKPSCGGYADPERVVLNELKDEKSQFLTLVHELAHKVLGHCDIDGMAKLQRQQKEVEAELSIVMALARAEIESTGSAEYIENWMSEGQELTPDVINHAIHASEKLYKMMTIKAF
jgi:hypothetical protein